MTRPTRMTLENEAQWNLKIERYGKRMTETEQQEKLTLLLKKAIEKATEIVANEFREICPEGFRVSRIRIDSISLLVTLTSLTTNQKYSHYITRVGELRADQGFIGEAALISNWMKRFVIQREEFHQKEVERLGNR